MLGFVVNNPVSRFVGNQFTKVGNWFEKENKEFETNEELRTSKHSRLTAARIVMKKLIAENNEYLSKENFESSKKILEDVTGITNLTYDEKECEIIDGGLTLDLAGIKPKITIYKASALTKEEMLVLCPELKEIHIVPQKPLKKEEDKKEEVKAEDKKQETTDTKEEKSEVKEEAKPEENTAEEKKEEPVEVKKEEPKAEEKPAEEKKIDPTAPADLGLKTQEELTEEKKVVVEIKNATTTEKIEQAVCEGHEKGEVKIVAPSKKEEKPVDKKPEAEAKEEKKVESKVEKQVETKEVKKDEKPVETAKPTVMVTFADKVKEGFSKFENEIFDKTIAKFSTGAKEGKLKFDIKITDVLVKKCDKENKIVTFVFVNDNKQYPLLETFYYTGNNKQSTTPFTDANSFIKAHKERNEAAKKDEKLKPKCYNIKYSTIPGYVAPAK